MYHAIRSIRIRASNKTLAWDLHFERVALRSQVPPETGCMATQNTKSGQQQRPMAIAPGEFFRMNPFSLMRRLSEEMARFVESGRSEEREKSWMPSVDVSQKEGNYVVHAELPGIKPEDVKLEITDEAIILQGERKSEQEETKGSVHLTERHYGRFYRAIPLPQGADTEHAKAKFDNGVLQITVPVEEPRSNRREIPIQGTTPAPGTPKAA